MKKYFFELRIVATIVACLAVIVVLVGCGKEDNGGSDGTLLTEIIDDDGWGRTTFEYDNQNRITKMTDYNSDGKVSRIQTLSYNSEGDLISLLREEPDSPNNEGYTITFTRSGNTITMKGARGDTVFELNAQGLLGQYTAGSYIETYQYQDKNLTKLTLNYETSEDSVTGTYTYDDKKSPLYHCKTPQWFLIYWSEGGIYGIQNNPKTIIHENYGSHPSTATTEFEYSYMNDEGYPISIKITSKYKSEDEELSSTDTKTLKYNTSSALDQVDKELFPRNQLLYLTNKFS